MSRFCTCNCPIPEETSTIAKCSTCDKEVLPGFYHYWSEWGVKVDQDGSWEIFEPDYNDEPSVRKMRWDD